MSSRGGQAFPGAGDVPSGSWWTRDGGCASMGLVAPESASVRRGGDWSRGGRACGAG